MWFYVGGKDDLHSFLIWRHVLFHRPVCVIHWKGNLVIALSHSLCKVRCYLPFCNWNAEHGCWWRLNDEKEEVVATLTPWRLWVRLWARTEPFCVAWQAIPVCCSLLSHCRLGWLVTMKNCRYLSASWRTCSLPGVYPASHCTDVSCTSLIMDAFSPLFCPWINFFETMSSYFLPVLYVILEHHGIHSIKEM